jgi:spoIIIJ-associated protein
MDQTSKVTSYVKDFLSKFNYPEPLDFSVNFDDQDNRYTIAIQTPQPSLVIGHHGENLSATKFLLSQHLHTLFGEWVNLTLNVNDYNERRERTLYELADSTISQVLSTNRPYALPPLSASERRLVHVYLANHPQVSTSSEGEGRGRTLIISPKV